MTTTAKRVAVTASLLFTALAAAVPAAEAQTDPLADVIAATQRAEQSSLNAGGLYSWMAKGFQLRNQQIEDVINRPTV
ncbi:hypothetical protein [Streptomyces sp. NPDC051183]|uniref:hypothetical protein n=1 Tax=Streptomyces sp. NPDC051183 TaxID=3155165 RepID=UPI0034181CF1